MELVRVVVPGIPGPGGGTFDVKTPDADKFVASFVDGHHHPDAWLESIDGHAIQVRHIASMSVWHRAPSRIATEFMQALEAARS